MKYDAENHLTCDAMRRVRQFGTAVCIGAVFVAHAGELPDASAKAAVNQPIAAELQPLQGKWEGVMVGHEKEGQITITISSNSLHFHRDTNFWFETTFTLPAGKNPKQIHATIKACPASQADSIGQVVRAFFKIENETLTLATIGDDAEETPKSFEAAATRYELRRVQPNPQTKAAEVPKAQ